MKRSDGKKAQLPVSGIVQVAFISVLSFIIFSAQAYGSPDIPAKAATAPAAIGETALFAGLVGGSALASQGFMTAANADFGTRAAPAFLADLQDGDALNTETSLDIEPVNGTTDMTPNACHDSCSL
jgi:hypothetical protein